MRAMVLEQPGPAEGKRLALRDLPQPQPGSGELLLQVLACGVCHTDLHIVEAELPLRKSPLVPGHEVVARVAGVGEGVEGFATGERVGVPWLYDTPADCIYRQRGLENLCPDARFTGYSVDGGYAEHMISRAEFTYHLPDSFSDAEAAPLLCAGVIGYRSLRLAELQPGRVLGLYGFGASAHIAIQIAVDWGCPVYVFTRSESHRSLGRELGARWAGGAEDDPGELMDCSVIFAPAGNLVPLALGGLRPGGTVACAGIHMSPIPQMDYDLLYMERTLRSVANSTRQDVRDLLAEADRIGLKPTVQTFPLERANEALVKVKHSEIDGAAVLIP